METKLRQGSKNLQEFSWDYWEDVFNPIGPVVTEEKKLTDAWQKVITMTHLEQDSGELKTIFVIPDLEANFLVIPVLHLFLAGLSVKK